MGRVTVNPVVQCPCYLRWASDRGQSSSLEQQIKSPSSRYSCC